MRHGLGLRLAEARDTDKEERDRMLGAGGFHEFFRLVVGNSW